MTGAVRAAVVVVAVGGGVCLLAAGCSRGGASPGARGAAVADGLSVAIYTGVEHPAPPASPPGGAPPAAPQPPIRRSVALIDDRRVVEIADGVLRLDDVAAEIELASLIVEPLDGRPLVVTRCAREFSRRAAPAHRATIVTEDGVEVTGVPGERVSVGGTPMWVVEDDAGDVHFVAGEVTQARVPGVGANEVRCDVVAEPGRRRVRLAYATTDLSWRASYRIEIAAGPTGDAEVAVAPSLAIVGTGVVGARRAAVSLLSGLPGSDDSPRLVWSGEVDLGPVEISVRPPPRVARARVEHLYRPTVALPGENPNDAYNWRAAYNPIVWEALRVDAALAAELADLPAGPALIDVTRGGAARQAVAAWPDPPREAGRGFHLALWADPSVFGFRERRTLRADGQRIVEQSLVSIANRGDAAVTVWVEDELRPLPGRELRKLFPAGDVRGDQLRFRIEIGPGRTERLGFEADYRVRP